MKAIIFTHALCLIMVSTNHAEDQRDETITTASGTVIAGSTVLTQALSRVDLSITASRVNMRHLQGNFGEHQVASYLHRGAQWTQMRQTVGRQGVDLIHLEVSPDGQIRDLMVSEVKTGKSSLGMTKDGRQMSQKWISSRLKGLAKRYQTLSNSLSAGEIQMVRAPSGLAAKQVLEVPLGKDGSALFWRENSKSPWKLSAKPGQTSLVQLQIERISLWLDGASDGKIGYRSRIFRNQVVNGKLVTTVKDSSLLNAGVPESKLPVLNRVEVLLKPGGVTQQAMTKAWADELRRTQPMLNDREIMNQAREHSKLATRNLNFRPRPLWQSMAKGASTSAAAGGALAGVIDLGVQLWSTGDVNFKQVGANTLIGVTAGASGYLAGSGGTFALMNTSAGLSVTRGVASSMGMSTSCSANLLGSSAGGGIAAAVFSYGLYFMGYADLESANRMAVAGVASGVAGAAAMAAATSLVATYGVAGTGTAIASLHGAAATSALTAAMGGTAGVVASTGVGLIVIGVGAGVMWGFTAYDEGQETKRLEITADYLLNHYGRMAR
jgi:hypothetical protein